MMSSRVWPAFRRLENYVESKNYAGYDCYDALRSPVLNFLGRVNPWVRIASIQFLKRCPLNLRPLLGISPGHNPKGLGLFLSGTCRLLRITGDQKYLKNIDFLDKLLLQNSSKGYSGMCWGYNFDWQSRVFFVPAFTPTIVNSAYVAHSYLDAYDVTTNPTYLERAQSTCQFILKDLNRTETSDGWCFSYTPIDDLQVHNANILGAGLLARVAAVTHEPELDHAADQAAQYVLAHQQENGSWHYAETSIQKWIDSFHTGFVLDSLHNVMTYTGKTSLRGSIEKGLGFYLEHFFESDGTPRYFHNRTWPADIHSAAQAIVTLTTFRDWHPRASAVLDSVLDWTLTHMQSPRGYFYFQKHRIYTNRVPYMRWSQAWMFHAMTTYLAALESKNSL